VGDQSGAVDIVLLGIRRVGPESLARAAQQSTRAFGVATLDVGEPDGVLGQPLPEHPLGNRPVLPRRLQYLVGIECQSVVQQLLSEGESLLGAELEVVGNSGDSGTAGGQRSAESIARAVVTGTTCGVTVTGDHSPMIHVRPRWCSCDC
jgi:hypothetical protein